MLLNSNTYKRLDRTSFDFNALPRSKTKLLQILPDLAEEDEFRSPSPFSKRPAASKPAGASRVFPVDLTNISETSFSQPPRRAPRPPAKGIDQDDDSITDLCLNFPSPPDTCSTPTVSLTRSPATKLLPMRFRKPPHSPTSSISSDSTASLTSNASSQLNTTPATSDDDDEAPSSVTMVNSKRLSLIFAKSLPDLHRDVIQKFIQFDNILESESDEEEADRQWITQDMKDFITLAPLSQSLPGFSDENMIPARPESFLPPPRSSRRYSRIIHPSTGPSAQLDPTFPFSPRKQRPCPPVPNYPPPLPPVSSSEHLAIPSSATNLASPLTPLTSTSICLDRPPPRSSVPFDIDELMQMDLHDYDLFEDMTGERPDSPFSCICPDYRSSPTTSLGFDLEDLPTGIPSTPGHAIPDSPLARMYSPESPLHRQASFASISSTHRHLRSRWSSSTLSSLSNQQSPVSSSWMTKFSLRNKKSKVPAVPSSPSSTPTKAVKREKQRKFTGPDLLILNERRIDRRDSRSSRKSSDSTESTSSVGLKRKPIPVEIFMKA